MKKYCVVVTSEIASPSECFMIPGMTRFFTDYDAAVNYGAECCEEIAEYPALADFYIYELIAQTEFEGYVYE